jgi:hypothetical protein
VRYAINEMYARHGYDFPKKEIKNVFLKYRWYRQLLKPERSTEDIEGEFNEYEAENVKLLGQLRDRLQGKDLGETAHFPTHRPTEQSAGTESCSPPEIHAWVDVSYTYRSSEPHEKIVEKPNKADAASATEVETAAAETISTTERESLPNSHLVTRGSAKEQVIESKATIAPLNCSVRLTCKSNRDSGTLTVSVVDTISDRVLEGFPVSSDNAIEELKQRDSVHGSEGVTDFGWDLPDSEKAQIAHTARKWIIRDEGEDRGEPKIETVRLHIALGPPPRFSP